MAQKRKKKPKHFIFTPPPRVSDITQGEKKALFLRLEKGWRLPLRLQYPYFDYYDLILGNWVIGLNWFYKFALNPTYKIPGSAGGKLKFMRSFGGYLAATWRLCHLVYQYSDTLEIDQAAYPDAVRLFERVALDIRRKQLFYTHSGAVNQEIDRGEIKLIKEGSNPYKKSLGAPRPHFKHLDALIDYALKLSASGAPQCSDYDSFFWGETGLSEEKQGFVKAFQASFERQDYSHTFFISEGKDLLVSYGSGKNYARIPPYTPTPDKTKNTMGAEIEPERGFQSMKEKSPLYIFSDYRG